LGEGLLSLLSTEDRDLLERIVRHHMDIHALVREGVDSSKALKRFIRKAGADIVPYLMDLTEADRRGNLPCTEADMAPYKEIRQKIFAILAEPPPLLPVLSGDEVMEILGCESGPAVGEAMRKLKENGTRCPEKAREIITEGLKTTCTYCDEPCSSHGADVINMCDSDVCKGKACHELHRRYPN
jgi:nucleotidyltransferase/DNA polymerase involved in DNA repair